MPAKPKPVKEDNEEKERSVSKSPTKPAFRIKPRSESSSPVKRIRGDTASGDQILL